jgi:hypothetical protein
VQSVVTRPSAAPGAPVDTPSRLTRLWRRSLAWHAAALFGLLLLALLLTLPDQLAHADEGVAQAQAQLLADGDGWSTPHALAAADPDARAFPLGGSTQREGTDEFVPFSKHPVYPVLLAPFVAVFGIPGGALLSVLGTVAAAVATALLAGRQAPSLARPALWSFGMATPMWFNSFVTIAHPLGAAAVGFAALLVLRRDPSARHIAPAAGLVTLAVLLRNEAILFGVAFACALVVGALVRRERRAFVAGSAVFAATVVGYLLDARLASLTLGGNAVEPFSIRGDGGSFLSDRLEGFSFTVLAPTDGTATGLLLSTLGLVMIGAAALTARRRPGDTNGILVFLGAAALAEALRWFVEPSAHIPGLLFAAPLLVGGLLLVDRSTIASRDVATMAATAALFFAAVVATQYANGGGGGWGGRYFSIALPLAVPVALLGFRRVSSTIPANIRPTAVALCIAIAGVLVVGQSTSLLVDHRLNRSMDRAVADATSGLEAGDGGARPVVVSTRRGLGRMEFRAVLEQRWIEVPDGDEDVVPYIERLHALGIERFVLITAHPDEVLPRIAARYAVVRSLAVTATDVLGRQETTASTLYVLDATAVG